MFNNLGGLLKVKDSDQLATACEVNLVPRCQALARLFSAPLCTCRCMTRSTAAATLSCVPCRLIDMVASPTSSLLGNRQPGIRGARCSPQATHAHAWLLCSALSLARSWRQAARSRLPGPGPGPRAGLPAGGEAFAKTSCGAPFQAVLIAHGY